MATNSTSKFVIKISILLIPYIILTFILHDGGSSGGVGGGGYDLSGLVYGLLLFTVTGIWLIWMGISYLVSKNAEGKKLHLRLLILGMIALIAAWFITPRMF